MDLDQYLEGIQAGNLDDFGRWLSAAELPLRMKLHSFAGVVDVEAIVQETMLRIWQVAPKQQSDGKPNSLLRLAYRIARNLALDELRKHRLEFVEQDTLERMSGGQDVVEPDPLLRDHIADCKASLMGRPAKVFALRLSQGGVSSDDELAAKLGMTRNTFLQNFTRARKWFEECLEKKGINLAAVL